MSGGFVSGGWGYVWAAYSLTTIALVLYGVTLFARLRQERLRQGGER